MARSASSKLLFQQMVAEDRRMRMLVLLGQAPGGMTNEDVLANFLRTRLGHNASKDMLRNDLMWLHEMLFVELRMQSPWVAAITTRGLDIAHGRAKAYGLAELRPDELL